METPVTVLVTILLIAAVWLTASHAASSEGMAGVWVGVALVLVGLVACAAVSAKVAFWSVVTAVAVFRCARWFRDQDLLGSRALPLYLWF